MFLTPTLEAASARVTAAQLDAAGALLETAWKKDALRWPRRLKPFLASLSSVGRRAFRDLVEKGCQPDALALSFHDAANSETKGRQQHHYVRDELAELELLGSAARMSLAAFKNRRHQLDEYFVRERLRVVEPEMGVLADLCAELDQVLVDQRDDLGRIRRQVDGRRQLFHGHPLFRLSARVHRSTKAYRDAKIEHVLADLREAHGLKPLAPGTIKRRRSRWSKRLDQGGTRERSKG